MIKQLIIQVAQWFSLIETVDGLDGYINDFKYDLEILGKMEGDEIIIDFGKWIPFNRKWSVHKQLGRWLDNLKAKALEYMDTRTSQPTQPNVSQKEPTIEQVNSTAFT
jgi:hypothetical protein